MASYLSVDEVYDDNKVLKETILRLENELTIGKLKNKELKKIIDSLIGDNAEKILNYFNSCSSIRKTAWKFGINMEELCELIPEWDGCHDGLQNADDYIECRIEVVGRSCYDDENDEYSYDELEERSRTPDDIELNNILSDYKDSNLSLYELADRYNLWINNLFRLLKENKIIDKETDVKYYAKFYTEYKGVWSQWDGKSEIGLIDEFYKSIC